VLNVKTIDEFSLDEKKTGSTCKTIPDMMAIPIWFCTNRKLNDKKLGILILRSCSVAIHQSKPNQHLAKRQPSGLSSLKHDLRYIQHISSLEGEFESEFEMHQTHDDDSITLSHLPTCGANHFKFIVAYISFNTVHPFNYQTIPLDGKIIDNKYLLVNYSLLKNQPWFRN